MIVGARSVHYGVRPGVDQPKPMGKNFTLEHLVFDILKCEPAKAHIRDVQPLSGGELAEHERTDGAPVSQDRPQQPQKPHPVPNNNPPQRAPGPDDMAKLAKKALTALLDAANEDTVQKVITHIDNQQAGALDATPHLTAEDREALGIDETETVAVDDVCAYATAYWAKHKRGPRAPLNEQGAA